MTSTIVEINEESEEDLPTFSECLKSRMFWTIYFMALFSVSKFFICFNLVLVFGLITNDIYKIFGDSRPNLDHETYLTEVSSICCIFNSLRAVWSTILDHYSYKKVYGVLLVMQIFLGFTFKWSAESMTTYAIWVWMA